MSHLHAFSYKGNKFAPCALISTMLVAANKKINLVSGFSYKLQNKSIAIQRRVGKIGNTLARPTLTIILVITS
jgi:hypothetical protein